MFWFGLGIFASIFHTSIRCQFVDHSYQINCVSSIIIVYTHNIPYVTIHAWKISCIPGVQFSKLNKRLVYTIFKIRIWMKWSNYVIVISVKNNYNFYLVNMGNALKYKKICCPPSQAGKDRTFYANILWVIKKQL